MTRLVIAVVLSVFACRVRVPVAPVLAPGLSVPLPAVLLVLLAAVALSVVCVRNIRRDGWHSYPSWRPACVLRARRYRLIRGK